LPVYKLPYAFPYLSKATPFDCGYQHQSPHTFAKEFQIVFQIKLLFGYFLGLRFSCAGRETFEIFIAMGRGQHENPYLVLAILNFASSLFE